MFLLWPNGTFFIDIVLLNRDDKPCQLTPGSSGLDLSSTMATILIPDMPVTAIPVGMASPLPEDIVRLVLGRSLLFFFKEFRWCLV